jgi:4-hydroxythreonine-4-phosphate dehydrogenase
MTLSRIAITTGEPAGIGPDVTLMCALQPWDCELVAIGSLDLLQARAAALGLAIELQPFDSGSEAATHVPAVLKVIDTPLAQPVVAGQLNPANADYVLHMLRTAVSGCQQGLFDAMVTGPVQKSVISDAGVAFSGHTEFLAQETGTSHVVMLLATDDLRVAVATTHLALREVADAITVPLLTQTLEIMHTDLRQRFGIASPRIAVLGLNPHAGEGGHLGREEIEIIIPALNALREKGLNLTGPLPADTAFNTQQLAHTDAYLAMYHDQGLPVLKYSGFGNAINITLGLPIIRTSVDHGTALDLAGTGNVSDGSLRQAISVALRMARASQG